MLRIELKIRQNINLDIYQVYRWPIPKLLCFLVCRPNDRHNQLINPILHMHALAQSTPTYSLPSLVPRPSAASKRNKVADGLGTRLHPSSMQDKDHVPA